MVSRLLRVTIVSALLLTIGLTICVSFGCGGASPFLAAQFATTISDFRGAGGTPGPPDIPTTQPDDGGSDAVLGDICTLAPGLRTLNVSIQNQAQQRVRFAITFAVSAGPGGFVCDAEVQNYINAGYTDAFAPGSANSFTIGCDTVQLLSGNRILRMSFGVDQLPEEVLQPNVGGDPTANLPTIQLRRRDNGLELLPIPEIIIFGNSSANFTCVGNDLCTQRGFVYSSINNLPIGKAVEAIRIQGTVCQTRFGTAPEWRLDKTLNDNTTQAFQFPVGGTIVATVLDRSGDSLNDPRNQVVWTVTNSANQVVHNPAP